MQALPQETEECFFCVKGTIPDASHKPFAHIETRNGDSAGKTYMTCAKCRPNIMSMFNSSRLRDGRRLPLSIVERDLRESSCVHCGRTNPQEGTKCKSLLFRQQFDVFILCKKCHDGVYTQLGIFKQKQLFQKISNAVDADDIAQ